MKGCRRPLLAWREARRADVPFHVVCAYVEHESSGGKNIFGHDPTIFVGAGKVTKTKYRAYKRERDRTAPENRRMQGVGPMQLTWWEFQDGADELGGCWNPRFNIRYACDLLARYRREEGSWFAAAKRYNGSEDYAEHNAALRDKWRDILRGE